MVILSFGIFTDLIPQGLRTSVYGGAWVLVLFQTLQGINKMAFYKLRPSSLTMLIGLLVLIGINIYISMDPGITIQRLIALVINILIAYGLAIRSRRDLSLELVSDAFRHVLIFSSIVVVIVYFVDPSILIDHSENSNLNGTFKGLFPMKNNLGRFMVMAILFEFTRKRLNFSLIGLAVFWLVVSRSATAIVAAATLVPIMFTKSLSENRWSAILLLVTMGIVLISFPVILEWGPTKVIFEELLDKSTDMSGRTMLWPYVIVAIAEHPWLGYGFSAFWESTAAYQQVLRYFEWSPAHSHNGFLQLLVDFGLIGALVFAYAYIKVSKFAIALYSQGISVLFSFCYLLIVFNFTQSELVGRNSFTFIFFIFIFFLSRSGNSKDRSSKDLS